MKQTVLITGATSGIGAACAKIFASNNYKVIVTGRRLDRLETLKKELETAYNAEVYMLCFDVQNKDACFKAIESIPENWRDVNILINNAGLALGRDLFDTANIDDWDQMIDTNVKGLLYMSRAVLPFLIAQQKGHIINIGSTAAKEVYEAGNTYCASKKAVEAISQAQRIDLLKYNIKVSCVHPGAVDTEFSTVRFKGDADKAAAVYAGYVPLAAEDVANTIYFIANLPSHVCINDLIITCTQQANSFYVNKNM